MVDINQAVRGIAEKIAVDLIRENGTNVSDTQAAVAVGRFFQELEQEGTERIIKLVNAFVKVANVHVDVQQYRVDDTGEFMPEPSDPFSPNVMPLW